MISTVKTIKNESATGVPAAGTYSAPEYFRAGLRADAERKWRSREKETGEGNGRKVEGWEKRVEKKVRTGKIWHGREKGRTGGEENGK